jgi:hypothetical protein
VSHPGNPCLAWVLGEAAVSAGKTKPFLSERYRRSAPPFWSAA